MFPEAGNFLEWYHVRRFHFFPSFREGLHSGVNLAESGNAKWKPHTKLSLVAAALDDVTIMKEQECEYKRFKEGESIPIGRGPTDIRRATQEKRMQMEQVRAIGEMFTNQVAVDMQSVSEKDPDYFTPSKAAKHKPGKGTKTIEGKKKHKNTPILTLNQLLEKLNKAKRISTGEEGQEHVIANADQPAASTGPVLGSGTEPRPVRVIPSTDDSPNPPYVTTSLYNVSKCHGCPAPIQSLKRKLKAPNDLLFKFKAIRSYRNTRTQLWLDKIGNIYFNLKLDCLQNFKHEIKVESTTMTNEVFVSISEGHMTLLREKGLLDHIVKNTGEDIQVC